MSRWSEILMYASMLSVFIPLACCIYRIRQLNATLWVLFTYLLFSVFTELGSLIRSFKGEDNYLLRQLFTMVECASLGLIYLLEYRSRPMRFFILFLYAVFALVSWHVLIFSSAYSKQDSILLSIEAGIMLMLSGLYFLKLLRGLPIKSLKDFYFVWINMAVLFYFSISLFIFLFLDFYIEKCPEQIAWSLWAIHSFGNMLYHSLMAVGIWKILRFGRL